MTATIEDEAVKRAELDRLRAAAQQREAGLMDAVERLVVVLDRNDKKGPIPDVEMMFCWLAAQDIRAAFRAALSHNGRKDDDTL